MKMVTCARCADRPFELLEGVGRCGSSGRFEIPMTVNSNEGVDDAWLGRTESTKENRHADF